MRHYQISLTIWKLKHYIRARAWSEMKCGESILTLKTFPKLSIANYPNRCNSIEINLHVKFNYLNIYYNFRIKVHNHKTFESRI